MKKRSIEFSVGIFVIIGMVCLAYISIKLGRMEILGNKGYEVYGIFSNTGGLRDGASVVIAGVEVGSVKKISLDNYQAKVIFSLDPSVKIQDDAIASIKTKGLIGEKYIEITPGGADQDIKPNGQIRETQPAVDLESLISKVAFGKV